MKRISEARKPHPLPFREEDYPARRGYMMQYPIVRGNYSFPPHYHDGMEFFAIPATLSGTIRAAGQAYQVPPSSVVFIPPRAIHSFILHSTVASYEQPVLKIGFKWAAGMLASLTGYSDKSVRAQLRNMTAMVKEDYYNRFMEQFKNLGLYTDPSLDFHRPYPDGKLECAVADSSIIMQILSEFISLETSQQKRGKHEGPVRRIIDIIAQHFREQLDLDEIAQLSYVSKWYMCRVFKEYTGMTVRDYLNQMRIEHAKKLIRQGETNMTKLALDCGYKYPSYFSRVFAEIVGVSPKKWSRK